MTTCPVTLLLPPVSYNLIADAVVVVTAVIYDYRECMMLICAHHSFNPNTTAVLTISGEVCYFAFRITFLD